MKKFALSLLVSFLVILSFPLQVLAQGAFTGSTQGNLAVTPKDFDNIGDVLQNLGYSSTQITESDLVDSILLSGYDSVYINCSSTIDNQAEQAAEAIRQYVEGGGILYASDWANSLVSKAFPGKINFYQGKYDYGVDDTFGRVGESGIVNAEVVDSGLLDVLGKSTIEINYDLPYWVVIDSVGAGVRIHMQGPAKITQETGGEDVTLEDKPYVVSFHYGKGEVLYTTFHNEAQTTSDVERVLEWFAVRVRAGKLVQDSRNSATKGSNLILKETVDALSTDETGSYSFKASGRDNFFVILNTSGESLNLTVKDPDGIEVLNKSVSKFPLKEKIDAKAGTYTIDVKGENVSENTPIVLTISGPESATDEPLDEALRTFEGTGSDFADFLSENKWYFIIGGGVIAFLFLAGVGTILLLILRKKK